MNPLVSVLMPVYNAEKYLQQSIDSILTQTFTDFELILLDDGSVDQSVKIIKTYKDPRIELHHNDKNKGLSFGRNRLLDLAKGEFIAWLDADDVALPLRLEKQVNFLQRHPNYVMVGGGVQPITEDGKNRGKPWIYKAASNRISAMLFFNNTFAQSAVMIRASGLPVVRYRPEYPPVEDYELWTRMAANGNVWNLPDILVQYRIHQQNITHRKEEQAKQAMNLVRKDQLIKLVDADKVDQFLSALWFPFSPQAVGDAVESLMALNRKKNIYDPDIFEQVAARFALQQIKRFFGVKELLRSFIRYNFFRRALVE